VAYEYTLSRPQGFRAIAIDAWQAKTDAELWLLVRADSAHTTAVISSLSG
jgi:hypothetical protein